MENNSALTNEQSSFSILPNELFMIILSYITRRTDKTSISLVSRKWWKISWSLATELNIYFGQALKNKMQLEDFQLVLQHNNNVTALHFKHNLTYSVPDSWMESFCSLTRLSHLTFTTWETLQVSNIGHIKSLKIGSTHQKYIEELTQLTNLTHLDLSDSIGLMSALAIEHLTNLVSLSLTAVYDSGMSVFKALTNLTKLEIHSTLPSNDSISAITNLHNLKSFSMDSTADSIQIDSFIQLTSLESISLRLPSFFELIESIGNKPDLLPKLLQMTNLTKLVLVDALFDNASWSLLTQMTKLKCLDLKDSLICVSANSGRSIESLQQLQKFKIAFNDDINVMLETIIDSGIVLKSLVILYCALMTPHTINLIVQLTSLEKLELFKTALDDDIYHLTVLSNLRSLSVFTEKPMSAQPFLALTKLRNLELEGEVINEEIDLIQPSTMIFLEKFTIKNTVKRF